MGTVKEALEDGSLSLEDEIDYADMTEEDYKKEIEILNNKLNLIKNNIDTITKKEILNIIENYTGFFGGEIKSE